MATTVQPIHKDGGKVMSMSTNQSSIQDLIGLAANGGSAPGEASQGVTAEEDIVQAGEPDAYGDSDTVVRDSESTEDANKSESGDTPTDSAGKGKANSQGNQQTSGDKEVITITDEKGRRKVEIDYSNKEAIKKAFQFQYGARKWQAERDQAIKAREGLDKEYGQLKADWSKLDEAFARGPEHLIDLLSGRTGAFDELVNKRMERINFLKNASPDEIQALEAREKAELTQRELEKIRKENEDFKKQVQSERELAEEKALESKVHPTFDKYRFADKLGDADDEQMFDEMLWNSALKRLESYESQGLELSKELIDREFRTVATTLRKRIGVQAEKTATKVVEQKKREATENVQAKVMSGYKAGGAAQEASDLLKNNDIKGLIQGWGKYGSFLGGGKKK